MKKFIPLFGLIFLQLFVVSALAYNAPTFYGHEVVVTASKRPQLKDQSFANVRVVTSDDIEKTNAKNVAEAVEYITGIYIKATGGLGGINSLKLKSANSQQVLILVDGARINSTLLGMYDIADISTSNVERIEIVDEAVSSLYGTDAIGGVINIITKTKQQAPMNVFVRGGSFGETGAGISLSGNVGKGVLFTSYSGLKADGYRTNSDYKTNNFTMNYSVEDVLSVKLNTLYSERGNPGVPSSDTDLSSASTPLDRQKDNSINLSVGLNGKSSENNTSKFTLSRVSSDQNVYYQDSFVPGLFYDNRYYSSISGVELINTTRISKYVDLTAGAEWKKSEGDSSKAGRHFVENNSFFMNSEIGAGLPLAAYIGARLDKNSVWGDCLNPRIGMTVSFDQYTRMKTSMATAFRSPTINELYWNEPSWGMFGNPNLRPENSNNLNITLEKDNGASRISLNYYKNSITDMIRWSPTAPFVWQPVNIDSAKIEGVGIELGGRIFGPVSAFVNCNFENSVDNATNKILTYSPLQKVNAGLEYLKEDITAVLQLKARSNVFYDSYETGSAVTKVLDAYKVADLNVSKKFKRFKLSIKISNLFNENYFESIGTSTVDWKERPYPMPGRRFEVGVSM